MWGEPQERSCTWEGCYQPQVLPTPFPHARLPTLFRADSEGSNGTSVMKTYWIARRITNRNQMDNASGRETCLMVINMGHSLLRDGLANKGKSTPGSIPTEIFQVQVMHSSETTRPLSPPRAQRDPSPPPRELPEAGGNLPKARSFQSSLLRVPFSCSDCVWDDRILYEGWK